MTLILAVLVNAVLVQTPSYPADVSASQLATSLVLETQRFESFDLTQQLQLVPAIAGPYTVPNEYMSQTNGCNTVGISASVVAQGGPAFFGPPGTITIYVYPQNLGAFTCGYYGASGGVTPQGAGFAWAWAKKLGWGLGYALGLKVAGSEWCNAGKPCQYLFPYGHIGDHDDEMGSGDGLNAISRMVVNALKATWIPPANQIVAPANGSFLLAALDLPLDSQPRVLTVNPATVPVYVEVRRDATHTFVLLHERYQGTDFAAIYVGTILKDADTADTTPQETIDAELSVGQCRVVSGANICTTGVSDGSATISVTYGVEDPAPPPPTGCTKGCPSSPPLPPKS